MQPAEPLQPQTPPTQAIPEAWSVQFVQFAPHASGDVSAMHALPTQQLPLPHVPSPAPPHAEVHAPPEPQVGVPPEQPMHTAPVAPQAPFAVPATHWPAVASQHPPLQAESSAPPQAAPQVCVVTLHACPPAQSVAAVQPHASVPGMQCGLPVWPVQSTQEPDPPQAMSLVPGRQVPPVPQQPATQGEPPEHV
jgi:hypothetical protein